ncbi:MAG: hypothetical protein JWL60_1792 [Gemmatimonadetes bacterium]|nr:hypothetical protein [Gemmatimonadota bacterium]
MSTHIDRARRLLVPIGLLAVIAGPVQAQGTGATTGAQTTTTTNTDTTVMASQPEEDRDFPWGLLGLLGLAGLLKRPQREVVVQREPVVPHTSTGRPGDPNYRV